LVFELQKVKLILENLCTSVAGKRKMEKGRKEKGGYWLGGKDIRCLVNLKISNEQDE